MSIYDPAAYATQAISGEVWLIIGNNYRDSVVVGAGRGGLLVCQDAAIDKICICYFARYMVFNILQKLLKLTISHGIYLM